MHIDGTDKVNSRRRFAFEKISNLINILSSKVILNGYSRVVSVSVSDMLVDGVKVGVCVDAGVAAAVDPGHSGVILSLQMIF